jgi:glycosyltransferase involved in cell wall biosynthesis
MKIAMLSWETLHSIAVGGVAPHVTELSAALAARGHDVHIFTRPGHGQARHERIGQVWYHRCPFDLNRDMPTEMNNMCNSFIWHLREAEGHMGSPFDVVHGHDWLCAKGVVRAKNERRNDVTVMTMHSTEYGRCGNNLYGGVCRIIRDFEWEGAFSADRVITVSNALKSEINWLYKIPEDKTVTIYNGVHSERYLDTPADVGAIKRRFDMGPMDPVVLFVGRLAFQKGPDILMNTAPGMLSHYRHAKYVFVGDGDMRPALERQADHLGVRHAVRFLGKRSGRELVELFHIADVLVVPSRNEPFGIVVLEGWAAGKPVVATRNGGPGEIIRHGRDGLHCFDRPDSVAWGVGMTLMDFDNARRMGTAGRERARESFAWDVIADQTEEVYKSIQEAKA